MYNKNYVERIIIAAPIEIANERYYMGVMLQRDNQSKRLYLHDVIAEKETALSTDDDLNTTGSPKDNNNLFLTNILQNVLSVNSNNMHENEKYSFNVSGGNGYDGYSMSNNARNAYDDGEKPMSKWRKADIIDAIRTIDPEKAGLLSKVNVKTLKDVVLTKTSWHHTSEYYNKTDFYSVDEDKVANLTKKQIKDLVAEKNEKPLNNTFRGDIT